MALDPRTPVIVGVGQITRHLTSTVDVTEPVQMMADALMAAAEDAGVGHALLAKATSLRIIGTLSWRYPDPAGLVAGIVGIDPAEQVRSATGGNSPQMLVNAAAASILSCSQDLVLITGAEAMYSRNLHKKEGTKPAWTSQPDETVPCPVMGDDRSGSHDAELRAGLLLPVQVYPLFENALRHAKGRTVDEHKAIVGGLWSRFSEVAAANPNGWASNAMTPQEITTPGPGNRPISFPYTKWQVANNQVDQAAAIIICSLEVARATGVSDDKMVFPLAGADGHDHWFVSTRHRLDRSVAIEECGRAVAASTGRAPSDAAHIDIYSCFPVAVEMAAAALQLPLDDPARPLTLTGGLTFGGGPGNNYATHGIAQVVGACRADPGSLGLSTALGWYATKHSLALYSTTPPDDGFRTRSVQDAVDASASREAASDYAGAGTLETSTVIYERDGAPASGIVAVLTPTGARAWATATDADLLEALQGDDLVGARVSVKDGRLVA